MICFKTNLYIVNAFCLQWQMVKGIPSCSFSVNDILCGSGEISSRCSSGICARISGVSSASWKSESAFLSSANCCFSAWCHCCNTSRNFFSKGSIIFLLFSFFRHKYNPGFFLVFQKNFLYKLFQISIFDFFF